MSCFSFVFCVLFLMEKIHFIWHHIVPTSNNITNNQPVPSVCVRVPHSPSLDSGGCESPPSPVDKPHHHDFTTLVVRESSTRIIYQIKKSILFKNNSLPSNFVFNLIFVPCKFLIILHVFQHFFFWIQANKFKTILILLCSNTRTLLLNCKSVSVILYAAIYHVIIHSIKMVLTTLVTKYPGHFS